MPCNLGRRPPLIRRPTRSAGVVVEPIAWKFNLSLRHDGQKHLQQVQDQAMNSRIVPLLLIVFSFQWITNGVIAMEPAEVFSVWPDKAPGETGDVGPEKRVEGRRRPFYQITDVSEPTVSVFLPPKERRTGAAVMVCPGGGLQRLAIEHEGLEVAQWLTSRDIAVFVLKYRVPWRDRTERWKAGLQDAQRALSLIRARSEEWDVDPNMVGVLGFSAGGEIVALLSTYHNERQYESIDGTDAISCRPDFGALVYPGGLLQRRPRQLRDDISSRLNRDTPPMFFVHAFDDSCENSLRMVLALKRARVPAELHIFQEGGHGFAARETGNPLHTWKQQFERWMQSQGFLDKAPVRNYEQRFFDALQTEGALPRFSDMIAGASMDAAYAVQRRLVRRVMQSDEIGGFKGAAVSAEAQRTLGIDRPLTAVLLRSGTLKAEDRPVVELPEALDMVVETEIGYITSVDMSYKIKGVAQAKGAVEAIVPVIELPVTYGRRMGKMATTDLVAVNVGSSYFIKGSPAHPDSLDPDAIKISLKRDGQVLHEAVGAAAQGGQWENLLTLINQIIDQGYTIRKGSLIISGALGKIQPGQPGKYHADYGDLGSVQFELQ